jgi:tRNA threonylcarbamoyladenosine biosynthesis protein TsaE
MLIKTFNIKQESKTKFLAEKLSSICNKGDILAISGEMGAGKTTFIKYFIKKISKIKNIPSPSYNIMLSYETEKFTIYHMDVWRLKNCEEALSLGITDMFDKSIFLIEWADKIQSILPSNSLKLFIDNINNKKVLRLEGNKKWNMRLKNLIDS